MDKMLKVVVWLDQNYKRSDTIWVSSDLTKQEITKIVNSTYEVWFYYDIW